MFTDEQIAALKELADQRIAENLAATERQAAVDQEMGQVQENEIN